LLSHRFCGKPVSTFPHDVARRRDCALSSCPLQIRRGIAYVRRDILRRGRQRPAADPPDKSIVVGIAWRCGNRAAA
jgi:hypothetical protein